ncbi:MAG: DUF6976 family protein [Aquabacterium sp.]
MSAWRQALVDHDMAVTLIESGAWLTIAGDEMALSRLPRGRWIGGTIPYFMGQEGGQTSRTELFVTVLDQFAGHEPHVALHDVDSLSRICVEAPDNGFSLLILPAFSAVHSAYAQHAPAYEDMYLKPVVGWVAGVHLDDMGQRRAKVVDGTTGRLYEDRAVVLHVPLPDSLVADVRIVNLFQQGAGPTIRFDQDGFDVADCLIDGVRTPLASYLHERGHDTRLPLVADCNGAAVNVSFRWVDPQRGRVAFYGPVFSGVDYRLAQPFAGRYDEAFAQAGADLPEAQFSCNCILNYLYGELEGRRTGEAIGPMTFGEVAYQLLNQTMVQLTLSLR